MHDIVPAHGETPRRIDEASRVRVEATRDRVHDGEFAESIDRVEHHDSDDEEVNEERAGTTVRERLAGADEETSTDRTTNRDHVHVARRHGAVERVDGAPAHVALLERPKVEAIPRHEILLVARLDIIVDGREGRRRRLLFGSVHAANLFFF